MLVDVTAAELVDLKAVYLGFSLVVMKDNELAEQKVVLKVEKKDKVWVVLKETELVEWLAEKTVYIVAASTAVWMA